MRSMNWAIFLVTFMDYLPTEGPAEPFCFVRWDDAGRYENVARSCRPDLNNGEIYMLNAIVMITAMIWALVTARLVDVIVQADPDITAFKQMLDDLNKFMDLYEISSEPTGDGQPSLRRRLREFLLWYVHGMLEHAPHACIHTCIRLTHACPSRCCSSTRETHFTHARDRILLQLSPELQWEVVRNINGDWFRRVPFFKVAPSTYLVQIALSLEARVYPPSELIEPSSVCVLRCALAGNRTRSRMRVWHPRTACSVPQRATRVRPSVAQTASWSTRAG